MTADSRIVSFVLRFVVDQKTPEPDGPASDWYGVIRHVQSDEEAHLTRWEDISAFIRKYVDLGKDAVDE
jgi:hypothetical protein